MQSLAPCYLVAADFQLPIGVRETIQGDCSIYALAPWVAVVHYAGFLIAIVIGIVIMWAAVNKGPHGWSRIAFILMGGMFLFSGTILLPLEYASRKDYVAVAPDHMVFVNYGKPRVVRYQDIQAIEWWPRRGRRWSRHYRTTLTMFNGERMIEHSPVAFAASQHAGQIMVAQGLVK